MTGCGFLNSTRLVALLYVGLCLLPARVDSVEARQDTVLAQILEYTGSVWLHPRKVAPTFGQVLTSSDTVNVASAGSVTLVWTDGSVSKVVGPAQVSISGTKVQTEANLMGKLTTALRNFCFSKTTPMEEAVLGVRGNLNIPPGPMRVPRIVFPPSNSCLVDAPTELVWQPITDVVTYSVSLYGSGKLLWQSKTSEASVKLPAEDNLIRPGYTYLWVVDAEVGDGRLRSEQATFSVLNGAMSSEATRHLSDIDQSVSDMRLRHLLRILVLRKHKLYVEAYRDAQAMLDADPSDHLAVQLKAEFLERMGLIDEALELYKSISAP